MKPRPQSLAAKLIEFGNFPISKVGELCARICIEGKNPDGSYTSPELKEEFSNAAFALDTMRQWDPFGNTFDNYCAEIRKETNLLAREVAGSARFTLDTDVLKAIEKMMHRPLPKVLESFESVRPPFDKIWIEFDTDPINQRGYLVKYDRDAGITIRTVSSQKMGNDFAVVLGTCKLGFTKISDMVEFTPIGLGMFERDFYSKTAAASAASNEEVKTMFDSDEEHQDRLVAEGLFVAMNCFLLMNSRSKILKHGEETRPRGKLGYRDPIGTSPVTFDLSRIMKKNPGMTEQEAKGQLGETLVRRHLKIRKTGIFWWDAHLRNKRPDVPEEIAFAEQLARRERRDLIRHPERPLTVPGTDVDIRVGGPAVL